MRWRTETRPNGQRDHREMIQGWDVWLPRLVGVLALAGSLWKASAWCSSISHNVEAVRVEQQHVKDDLRDKVAAALAEHDIAAEHITRAEWLTGENARDARTGRIEGKLDNLIEGQYRTHSLLEKLPGAQEPR